MRGVIVRSGRKDIRRAEMWKGVVVPRPGVAFVRGGRVVIGLGSLV